MLVPITSTTNGTSRHRRVASPRWLASGEVVRNTAPSSEKNGATKRQKTTAGMVTEISISPYPRYSNSGWHVNRRGGDDEHHEAQEGDQETSEHPRNQLSTRPEIFRYTRSGR